MADRVIIDGSFGEGGGQILRTALALSAVTGRDLEIFNIRARRTKPGLHPQHRLAVKAVAAICGADVHGAELGSQSVRFTPGPVKAGAYRFDIGTAGSTGLVLQALYLPLMLAGRGASTVTITGGTHVPMSPCFHYLDLQWRHFMERIGLTMELRMESAGYYPRGGGVVIARIPTRELLYSDMPDDDILPSGIQQAGYTHDSRPSAVYVKPVDITNRGSLREIRGISSVTGLPMSIAERQRNQAQGRLRSVGCPVRINIVDVPGVGQGTMLLLLAVFENGQACYYGLGARGKRAEAVADEAVDQLLPFIRSTAAIDAHLADQIILPLAFAGGRSVISTPVITQHLITNIEVIKQFVPARFEVAGEMGTEGMVTVEGAPAT
ncbi:MAG TPA: RNA 3'-terminal phosphate cyclase [Planctomycetota bacterium]|nr:RNA 3'-terminal phosphate cyclase [Planctomycetota bacterium]